MKGMANGKGQMAKGLLTWRQMTWGEMRAWALADVNLFERLGRYGLLLLLSGYFYLKGQVIDLLAKLLLALAVLVEFAGKVFEGVGNVFRAHGGKGGKGAGGESMANGKSQMAKREGR